LVGIIVALYLVWLFATESRTASVVGFVNRYGNLLLVLVLTAGVVVAPLALYYAEHPDTISSRADQVSILSREWMENEKAYTGRSATSILLRQFGRAISAFHYTPDPTYWYHPSVPLLDVVSGVLIVLGMVWSIARWRQSGNALLLIWFWMAVVMGWALTENPPSGQRMVIVAPAAALLVALGLDRVLGFVQRTLAGNKAVVGGLAAAVLALIALLNLYHYFVVYTPSGVYGNPTAEVATRLGRYLRQQDDGLSVHFYGPPSMYWDIGNLSFLAPDAVGLDVYPPEQGARQTVLAQDAHYVFLPHRLAELDQVKQQLPGGIEQSFHSEFDGRLLFVLYTAGAP
jgi:hypothetical protein